MTPPLKIVPLLLVFSCLVSPALSAEPFITGAATYEISLDLASGAGKLGGLTGTLIATLRHECDAYLAEGDLVADIVGPEGTTIPMTVKSKLVERGDTLDFDLTSTIASMEIDRAEGTATRTKDGLSVVLSAPEAKTLTLPGDVLFPVAMTEAAIAAAKAGKHLVEFKTFDGSGKGREVWTTSVLISPMTSADDSEEEVLFAGGLGFTDLPRWRMKFSYFQPKAGTDQMPAFATDAVVYENGFTMAAVYDFGQFAMKAKLVEVRPIPPRPCEVR